MCSSDLKCHQDLQLANDNGALRSYATKYVSKFSDAMADELLNDEAAAENLAISVLTKYKPYEPEMVLQLFGARFRQWALSSVSGGKVDFIVPWPDKEELPQIVEVYIASLWRGPNMSLLEFLRKANGPAEANGGLVRWSAEWGKAMDAALDNVALAMEHHMDELCSCAQRAAYPIGLNAEIDFAYLDNFGEEVVRGHSMFAV